jgi:hypothetical protein
MDDKVRGSDDLAKSNASLSQWLVCLSLCYVDEYDPDLLLPHGAIIFNTYLHWAHYTDKCHIQRRMVWNFTRYIWWRRQQPTVVFRGHYHFRHQLQ